MIPVSQSRKTSSRYSGTNESTSLPISRRLSYNRVSICHKDENPNNEEKIDCQSSHSLKTVATVKQVGEVCHANSLKSAEPKSQWHLGWAMHRDITGKEFYALRWLSDQPGFEVSETKTDGLEELVTISEAAAARATAKSSLFQGSSSTRCISSTHCAKNLYISRSTCSSSSTEFTNGIHQSSSSSIFVDRKAKQSKNVKKNSIDIIFPKQHLNKNDKLKPKTQKCFDSSSESKHLYEEQHSILGSEKNFSVETNWIQGSTEEKSNVCQLPKCVEETSQESVLKPHHFAHKKETSVRDYNNGKKNDITRKLKFCPESHSKCSDAVVKANNISDCVKRKREGNQIERKRSRRIPRKRRQRVN